MSPHPVTCFLDQLPNELITTILTFAVQASPSIEQRYHTTRIVQFVSTKWRDISISTPSLWTSIRAGISRSADGAKVSARRSGVLPLEIHLKLGKEDTVFSGPRMTAWTTLFREVSNRIQRVHVDVDPKLPFPLIVLGMFFKPLPNSMTLSASSTYAIHCILNLASISRFRALDLEYSEFTRWADLARFCSNVEEMRIVGSSGHGARVLISDLAVLLHAMPNLRALELGNQNIAERFGGEVGAVKLERLEDLVIRDFEMSNLKLFFRLFTAPRLRNLTVVGNLDLGTHPFDLFLTRHAWLPQKSPTLGALILGQSRCPLELAVRLAIGASRLALSSDAGDELFKDICARWGKLSQILPLGTVTVRGISAVDLTKLNDTGYLLPALRQMITLEVPIHTAGLSC